MPNWLSQVGRVTGGSAIHIHWIIGLALFIALIIAPWRPGVNGTIGDGATPFPALHSGDVITYISSATDLVVMVSSFSASVSATVYTADAPVAQATDAMPRTNGCRRSLELLSVTSSTLAPSRMTGRLPSSTFMPLPTPMPTQYAAQPEGYSWAHASDFFNHPRIRGDDVPVAVVDRHVPPTLDVRHPSRHMVLQYQQHHVADNMELDTSSQRPEAQQVIHSYHRGIAPDRRSRQLQLQQQWTEPARSRNTGSGQSVNLPDYHRIQGEDVPIPFIERHVPPTIDWVTHQYMESQHSQHETAGPMDIDTAHGISEVPPAENNHTWNALQHGSQWQPQLPPRDPFHRTSNGRPFGHDLDWTGNTYHGTESRSSTTPIGVFPSELWLIIIDLGLGTHLTLSPQSAGNLYIEGDLSPLDLTLLWRLGTASHQIRNRMYQHFFSTNKFVLRCTSANSVRDTSLWLNTLPPLALEFLDNIELHLDFAPGSQSRRLSSMNSIIRNLSHSRFLTRLTLHIDTSRVSIADFNNFRQLKTATLRLLGDFRGIKHLVITFIDPTNPWPGVEQWLTDRMTASRPLGVRGGQFMPSSMANLPAVSNAARWTGTDYENWGLAIGIDRQLSTNMTDRQMLRLIRNFKSTEKAKTVALPL